MDTKTAMQELKDRLLIDRNIFQDKAEYIDGILYDIENELLEKEKEQIMNAWTCGIATTVFKPEMTAKDYFTQTYGNGH